MSDGIIRGTVERTIVLGWNQDTTKINLEAYNIATTEKPYGIELY